MFLSHLKPAVPRNWLLAAAGLMWSTVGIMLCRLAWRWLFPFSKLQSDLLGAVGIAGAALIYYYGFSQIARKNIERLSHFSGKPCFFAFQAWRSYLIIVCMAALGITLRHSSIPRDYLAVVYVAIGGALFLSSFQYYKRLWRLHR